MSRLSLVLLVVMLAACQSAQNHPVPSVAQIGGNLKCAAGDHGLDDATAGWGFCYPATWRYNERSQASTSPPGLDLTFDITDIPCSEASAAPGAPTVAPVCSPNAGLFAFMIISTYERGDSTTLTAWVQANGDKVAIGPTAVLTSISWGDSTEAFKIDDGPDAPLTNRRIALTAHHVVILDLHSGQGNLDLEAVMGARLDTWKFTF